MEVTLGILALHDSPLFTCNNFFLILKSKQPQKKEGMSESLFGALSYSTSLNLGDNIQTLAALPFLPRVDYWIDRDNFELQNNKVLELETKPVKVIYNGWMDGRWCNWPPHPRLQPLFLSFHVNEEETSEAYKSLDRYKSLTGKSLLDRSVVDYYRTREPIGCRDYSTVEKFKKVGLDAYFSGCLTLTLGLHQKLIPQTERCGIYKVDVENSLATRLVPNHILAQAKTKTHLLKTQKPNQEKLHLAQELLNEYASASLVITSRLHCALPCLAFGTPLIFLHSNMNDCRWRGLTELMNAFGPKSSLDGIDWNEVKNPVDILPLAKKLQLRVEKFITDD